MPDRTENCMNVSDFYFELPQELIAQDPLEDRSASRLLVLDKTTGEVCHRHFRDITEYLRPGDCLVINDTKVIPARLYGVKAGTGAKMRRAGWPMAAMFSEALNSRSTVPGSSSSAAKKTRYKSAE